MPLGDVIELDVELHGGTITEAACRLDPTAGSTPGIDTKIVVLKINTEKPRLLPTKENPFALPHVLSQEEIQDCHRFMVQLLKDGAYIEQIAKHRQWKRQTICALAFDGHLGRDDHRRICFISAAGCKSRWQADGERRFKFLFGKSWLWRGELIPQAETIYLCEGETDAITLIDRGLEDDGGTVAIGVQGATLISYRRNFISWNCLGRLILNCGKDAPETWSKNYSAMITLSVVLNNCSTMLPIY